MTQVGGGRPLRLSMPSLPGRRPRQEWRDARRSAGNMVPWKTSLLAPYPEGWPSFPAREPRFGWLPCLYGSMDFTCRRVISEMPSHCVMGGSFRRFQQRADVESHSPPPMPCAAPVAASPPSATMRFVTWWRTGWRRSAQRLQSSPNWRLFPERCLSQLRPTLHQTPARTSEREGFGPGPRMRFSTCACSTLRPDRTSSGTSRRSLSTMSRWRSESTQRGSSMLTAVPSALLSSPPLVWQRPNAPASWSASAAWWPDLRPLTTPV